MSFERILLGVFAVVFCAGAGVCFGAVITVNWDGSGDYTTIQVGINAALDGDTITVADGVYTGDGNHDIRFNGKEIVVRGNTDDPNTVVIDCQGSPEDYHRGFYFGSGEDVNSVLEGLSVINGYIDRGGAIDCNNLSNPTIQNCILSNNTSTGPGGGINCNNSSPTIMNCEIINNIAENGGGIYGCDGTISN